MSLMSFAFNQPARKKEKGNKKKNTKTHRKCIKKKRAPKSPNAKQTSRNKKLFSLLSADILARSLNRLKMEIEVCACETMSTQRKKKKA